MSLILEYFNNIFYLKKVTLDWKLAYISFNWVVSWTYGGGEEQLHALDTIKSSSFTNQPLYVTGNCAQYTLRGRLRGPQSRCANRG